MGSFANGCAAVEANECAARAAQHPTILGSGNSSSGKTRTSHSSADCLKPVFDSPILQVLCFRAEAEFLLGIWQPERTGPGTPTDEAAVESLSVADGDWTITKIRPSQRCCALTLHCY